MRATVKQETHHLRWFVHRIGQEIIKNNYTGLFDPPIKILSLHHAKALWITQREKGYIYKEVTKDTQL